MQELGPNWHNFFIVINDRLTAPDDKELVANRYLQQKIYTKHS